MRAFLLFCALLACALWVDAPISVGNCHEPPIPYCVRLRFTTDSLSAEENRDVYRKAEKRSPGSSSPGLPLYARWVATWGMKVHDISATGARLGNIPKADLPARFLLPLSRSGGVRRTCTVKWQNRNEVGVRFEVSNEA
jgi:hypothetical protein